MHTAVLDCGLVINRRVFVVVCHRVCLPQSALGGQTEHIIYGTAVYLTARPVLFALITVCPPSLEAVILTSGRHGLPTSANGS